MIRGNWLLDIRLSMGTDSEEEKVNSIINQRKLQKDYISTFWSLWLYTAYRYFVEFYDDDILSCMDARQLHSGGLGNLSSAQVLW